MATPGYRMKFDRGDEHLETLDRAIRTFRTSKPYRVRAKTNAKRQERLYRVQRTKHFPDWCCVVGDIVHNYRSALDHLTCSIVDRFAVIKASTQFPIYRHRQAFMAGWPQKVGNVGHRGIKTAFERLQPYERRDSDSLWMLHRLDILDKHRSLLTTAMPKTPGIRLAGPIAGLTHIPGPYQYPTDIIHWLVAFPGTPVDVQFEPTFEVLIQEVEIEPGVPIDLPAMDTLRDIRDAVNTAIGELEGFVE
jgi:hypothetical protein